jgi:hypothetical protein
MGVIKCAEHGKNHNGCGKKAATLAYSNIVYLLNVVTIENRVVAYIKACLLTRFTKSLFVAGVSKYLQSQ